MPEHSMRSATSLALTFAVLLGACREPSPVAPQATSSSAARDFIRTAAWTRSSTGQPMLEIGVPADGRLASPTGINNHGVIIGMYQRGPNELMGFVWKDGVFTTLPTLGGSFNVPNDIDDDGTIVGRVSDLTGIIRPVMWKDGQVIPLTPAGVGGNAQAINRAGTIVGLAPHAVRWVNGVLEPLAAPPGAVSTSAVGINNTGLVVGSAFDGTRTRPVLWTNGVPTQLSVPADYGAVNIGGLVLQGHVINDAGIFWGYESSLGRSRAFIYRGGVFQRLPSIPSMPDPVSIAAGAINASGEIAGYLSTPELQRALFWTRSGVAVDLGTVAGTTRPSVAGVINDNGLIVGWTRWTENGVQNNALTIWRYEPDATPPTVAPVIAGTLGLNDWYTSDVGISWNVDDPESGIASRTGCEPSTIAEDTRAAVLNCSATNGAGLTTAQSVMVKRDATPPSVSFGPHAGSYFVDESVTIACVAGDAMSGLASSSCTNLNAAAYTLGLGRHTLRASAEDEAGNRASATTQFEVRVDVGSLSRLTRRLVTDRGIANSLCRKLDAGALGAYANEIRAQSGKKIAEADAALLIELSRGLSP
jgi:probable HAF family extracellular repeat protein